MSRNASLSNLSKISKKLIGESSRRRERDGFQCQLLCVKKHSGHKVVSIDRISGYAKMAQLNKGRVVGNMLELVGQSPLRHVDVAASRWFISIEQATAY